MRYIVNANNYITAISFGCYIECQDDGCTEYTGSVPTGYTSLEDWYASESEKLYRWKIVSGKLTMDSGATPPTDVSLYAPSSHKHAAGDITSGTLPISRGGTGATSAANARTKLGAASYEAGTWTPTDVNSCGLVWSSSTMNYTKIGRFVQVLLKFKAASSVKSKAVVIGGLPFTPNCTYPSSVGLWTSADGNGLAAKTGYCVTDAAQGSYYVTLVSSSFADIKDSDIGASRDVVISLYYQSSS